MIGHFEGFRSGDKPNLRDIFTLAKRRKWLLLGFTAITVGASLFYTSQQPVVFRSEARVLVRSVSFSVSSPTTELINLETEMSLARSPEVAALAAEMLPQHLGLTPNEASRSLTVAALPATELLGFTYTSADATTAQQGAQAFAEAYLKFRRSQFVDEVEQSNTALHERIGAAEERLGSLRNRLAATTDEFERQILESRIAAGEGAISLLNQQAAGLVSPEGLNVGRLIQAAGPGSPALPPYKRNSVLALVLGLSLAIGVALVRDQLDDRLRGQRDLEMHAGAAMLAAIPSVARWNRRKQAVLVSVDDPGSLAAEAYKTLRTSVLFAVNQRDAKTILVTSADPDEGKSTTTANLAVALASSGKRVLLVSADLRRPRLHLFFEKNNVVGLSTVLTGEHELRKAIVPSGLENIDLLPSGPAPSNPAELLDSDLMQRVLDQLGKGQVGQGARTKDYDIVLIDAPPLLPVADSMILASRVDAVILVADAENTRTPRIRRARERLDQVNAHLIGSLLNRASKETDSGTYYESYSSNQPKRTVKKTPPPPPAAYEPAERTHAGG